MPLTRGQSAPYAFTGTVWVPRCSTVIKMFAHLASVATSIALFTYGVDAAPAPGDIVCRYETTTLADVNYYTCKELALKYSITVEKFFKLNPSVDQECSTIKPNTDYCVAGCKCFYSNRSSASSFISDTKVGIQPPLAEDGFCGPQQNNATCAGLEKQCCNGETWKCGDQMYEHAFN